MENQPIGDLLISRIFNAPWELMFKIWTDSKQLAQWWGPRGFTNPVCELNLQPLLNYPDYCAVQSP